jgi:ubiquinone/menaquinone biosynthesis C-methylase UbiE
VSAAPAERYVPAAGRAAFTGAYDAVLAATMREARWRPALLAAVAEGLTPGATVVDVGAGTGTLAIALAAARPEARVIGVDGDPQVLGIARRKTGAERVDWVAALAGDLPLADAGADRIVLSLLLHHLSPAGRDGALREVRRVLRPGGRLHVADWGRPRGLLSRAAFGALRLLDGREATRDHAAGRLPAVLAAAGFAGVRRQARVRTGWGTLELLAAAG